MSTRQKRVLLILPKPFEEAGYVYLKRKFKKQGLQVRGLSSERPPSNDELFA